MQDTSPPQSTHHDTLKIILIYAIFSGLWILFSDQATEWLFVDESSRLVAQTLKGWLFVGVTSTLLYFLLKRPSNRTLSGDAPNRAGGIVNWKIWQLYVFAVAATFLTLLLRLGLSASVEEQTMLILLMLPIILSAALGGFGPGLTSTLIAAISATFFIIPPTGSFRIEHSYDVLQLGFLIANGLLVSLLSAMLHHARYRSERERQKTEILLAEKSNALQFLDAIAQGSTDAIFIKDIQGRYLLLNPAAARFIGKPMEEILGKDDTAHFPSEQARYMIDLDRQLIANGHTSTTEYELTTAAGKRNFLTTKGPMLDAKGNTFGIFGVARDITSLKLADLALRRERDLKQRYLDTVQTLMVALDTEGRITMINRYGCELLGYLENELRGENWFKACLPQPEAMQTIFPMFQQILAGSVKDYQRYENPVLCRDGSQRMISWRNTYLKDEVGNIVGTLSSGEDVTEPRKVGEALRESEATYRSLFEHMLNGFAYCRMLYVNGSPDDFIYLNVNDAFETQTGLKNVVDRKVSEIIPGIRASNPELFNIYGRVASGGRPEQFETYIQTLDMWFSIAVYSPKPEHFVAVFDTISERKKAEQALRNSSYMLQSVVENVPVRVFWKDRDARYLGCNDHFAQDAGYLKADDLTGKTDFEMGWKNQAELYRADDKAVMDSGVPKLDFEEPSTTPDGRTIWLRSSKVPLRDENNQTIGVLGIYEDITTHKAAEKALLQQTEEIRSRNAELERFNRAFVGRELDMITLKQQINELSRQLGQEPPYSLSFISTPAKPPDGDEAA